MREPLRNLECPLMVVAWWIESWIASLSLAVTEVVHMSHLPMVLLGRSVSRRRGHIPRRRCHAIPSCLE